MQGKGEREIGLKENTNKSVWYVYINDGPERQKQILFGKGILKMDYTCGLAVHERYVYRTWEGLRKSCIYCNLHTRRKS